MSTSKHIYDSDSEYPHIIIINHGSSESQVIYDSDDDNSTEEQKRIEHLRMLNWWGKTLTEQYENNLPKSSWLPEALKRVKNNGHLNEQEIY